MPRLARLDIVGLLQHVIACGIERRDIFTDDYDRQRFVDRIISLLSETGGRCYAWALLSNHIHLAIQVGEVPLSRIMQNLSFRYTLWINPRRNRVGHLFQGRFKAFLVDADSHLLELTAYIHLNPVRAGMTEGPQVYPWSSHRVYLGLEAWRPMRCLGSSSASWDGHGPGSPSSSTIAWSRGIGRTFKARAVSTAGSSAKIASLPRCCSKRLRWPRSGPTWRRC